MLIRTTTTILLILASTWWVVAQQGAPEASSVLTVGDPRSPYRIEVFYDLQCASCVSFHQKLKKVMDRFPEKVFVVFRHFPLSMHDNAFMASSVADAARRQGKGLEMIELLLNKQASWSTRTQPYQVIFGYVEKLGLDKSRFIKDVMSDDVARTVILDMNRARRLDVMSTPTVFLNGKLLSFVDSLELEEFISKGY